MTTSRETILELYKKERTYEEQIFGNYKNVEHMNVASLILIIEEYLDKAKKAYVGDKDKWQHELPDWLIGTDENDDGLEVRKVPVKTYEELIKVFALSGATLEAFATIDPVHWRENGIKEKWNMNIEGVNLGRK